MQWSAYFARASALRCRITFDTKSPRESFLTAKWWPSAFHFVRTLKLEITDPLHSRQSNDFGSEQAAFVIEKQNQAIQSQCSLLRRWVIGRMPSEQSERRWKAIEQVHRHGETVKGGDLVLAFIAFSHEPTQVLLRPSLELQELSWGSMPRSSKPGMWASGEIETHLSAPGHLLSAQRRKRRQ